MENAEKCLAALDFNPPWTEWRLILKKIINDTRTYYEDETVPLLLQKLNTFLESNVCVASDEDKLLQEMWKVAGTEERKVITRVLLKISS